MAGCVWIDVEDIFAFALAGGRRPTGIQRLAYELCKAMQTCPEDVPIRFVRHDRPRGGFVAIPWSAVEAVVAGLTEGGQVVAMREGRRTEAGLRRWLAPMAARLPREVREPLARALAAQFNAIASGATAARAAARLAGRQVRRLADMLRGRWGGERVVFAPGDVLFAPGAAFIHPGYPALIARIRRERGVRFALLLYDIIPVRRPEFVDTFHARSFRAWLDGILPECDELFAISRSAAAEVEDHARRAGLALRGPVRPIPIGTGFGGAPVAVPRDTGLPAPGSYVLFVSTLEARKNHLLLFRVWRRLLDTMPADEVPTLVFAGRVGWMVDDLMQQLRNTNFLDGRIVLVDQAGDAELAALYRGCLFTVFPSFYEGWGLPVSESLGFGKPCIVSNATALPEAGGGLAKYFDPDDMLGATALIRETIRDRAGLAEWTARVVREFTPVPWHDSARAILEHIA